MRVKKESLSDYLLKALEKTVDGLVFLEDITYHSYKYSQGSNIFSPKKSAISKAIRRLRESGYIETEVSDERRIILKLTTDGKII